MAHPCESAVLALTQQLTSAAAALSLGLCSHNSYPRVRREQAPFRKGAWHRRRAPGETTRNTLRLSAPRWSTTPPWQAALVMGGAAGTLAALLAPRLRRGSQAGELG